MVLASGLSDVGCRRNNNQDRISIELQASVFVVADGMGGEQCGGLAAEIAVNTVASYLRAPDGAPDSWPFGYDSSSDLAGNRMATAGRRPADEGAPSTAWLLRSSWLMSKYASDPTPFRSVTEWAARFRR